jgi:hypothetical protein
MNLHIQVLPAKGTADFRLLVSATGEGGENVATIASMSIDDPDLQTRLRDIAQAFRMGARYGREEG